MGFLRQLFGPSREEIWRQLCSEIGAQYVEGGFWKGDKVQAHCGQWTITLGHLHRERRGNYAQPTLGFGHPTSTKTGFDSRSTARASSAILASCWGCRTWKWASRSFDEAFIIKGNDETKLRALFANPKIRQLIEMQPSIY